MSRKEALRNVIVIQPLITIWSGEVTIKREEDLKSASGLPPGTLVSDGSKRIVDPKALTKLSTHRRVTQRELCHIGVRTPIGFVIQPDKKDEALKVLNERKQLFDQDASDFVLNYDVHCRQQENKFPAFKEFLRNKRPTAQYVESKCNFDYAWFQVAPSSGPGGEEQFEVIAKATTSSLAEQIASTASGILEELNGKDRAMQRTVEVVRDLVLKLEGFSMFDPRIAPSAKALQEVLDRLPVRGALYGTELFVLRAMLRQMSDPDDLLKAGSEHIHAPSVGQGQLQINNDVASSEQPAPVAIQQPVASGHTEEFGEFAPVVF